MFKLVNQLLVDQFRNKYDINKKIVNIYLASKRIRNRYRE